MKMGKRNTGHSPLLRMLTLCFVVPLCILFVSCPNTFDQNHVLQVKDHIGPSIKILSPQDGSSYASTVVVSGIVTDVSTERGEPGNLRALSYRIVPATIPGGDVSFNGEGSFSFQFATGNFSGSMLIVVTAEDWNGNRTEESILLLDMGAIPSFTGVPGNHEVTLSWDPVPNSASYTLYYTTNGSLPSENYGYRIDDVSSPYTIRDLENGSMCVFLLKSNASDGNDDFSEYVRAIPLSEVTLSPVVEGKYGKVVVEWSGIPATDEFEVYRATEPDGEYFNISGSWRGTRYIDTLVEDGQNYYYRVKPALEGSISSTFQSCSTHPFPSAFEKRIGFCDTPGHAYDVAVKDDFVFIADHDEGLHAIDISDPTSPRIVDTYDTDGLAYGVAVSDDYAYVADDSEGLKIINITDPAALQFVGEYDTAGNAQDVFISGTTAYVADGSGGLQIIDVQNPSLPGFAGSYSATLPNARGVEVYGNLAYVLDSNTGLQIINVQNPSSTWRAGYFNATLNQGIDFNTGLTVGGNYAYVTGFYSGLHIIDIQNIAAPFEVGALDVPGYHADVIVNGDYAYVASDWMGLNIVNIQSKGTPILADTYDTLGLARGLDMQGNYVYVSDENSGLQIIDVTIPSAVTQADVYATSGEGNAITVAGDYVCIGDWYVEVVNVADPYSIAYEGRYQSFSSVQALTVKGKKIYATFSDLYANKFWIISMEDPSAPVKLGEVAIPCDGTNSVDVCGDFAYVAYYYNADSGLQVIDISRPSSPQIVGACNTGTTDYAQDVEVQGGYAYIAVGQGNLQIFDVAAPHAPQLISVYDYTLFDGRTETEYDAEVRSLEVHGNHVYVVDQDYGLYILDISNPSAPLFKGNYEPPSGYNYDVAVSGNYAYLTNDSLGVIVIDISVPSSPMLVR